MGSLGFQLLGIKGKAQGSTQDLLPESGHFLVFGTSVIDDLQGHR
jgi:hypothetical protein